MAQSGAGPSKKVGAGMWIKGGLIYQSDRMLIVFHFISSKFDGHVSSKFIVIKFGTDLC